MPRQSADLIEWDGRYFCVLMEPYLFVLEPYLRGDDDQGTDLRQVLTVDGRKIPAAKHPRDRIRLAQEITLRAWQEWDARMDDSLLRHPAIRIHVDQDYDTVRQQRPVHDIIKRVFDRKRAEELARIAAAAERRRSQGG